MYPDRYQCRYANIPHGIGDSNRDITNILYSMVLIRLQSCQSDLSDIRYIDPLQYDNNLYVIRQTTDLIRYDMTGPTLFLILWGLLVAIDLILYLHCTYFVIMSIDSEFYSLSDCWYFNFSIIYQCLGGRH